jgi:hypothetical protein
MDSLSGYLSDAARGGPAGELLVRASLERALAASGVSLRVCDSDADFFAASAEPAVDGFGAVVLDPWTFVGAGWVPRPFLAGRESRAFLLSFFGTALPAGGHGLALAAAHVLTPYPYPAALGNTFLGFAVAPRWAGTLVGARGGAGRALQAAPAPAPPQPLPPPPAKVARAGVVWGKAARYLDDARWRALAGLAAAGVELHFTLARGDAPPGAADTLRGAVWHGHLAPAAWHDLLARSRFVLGLGDPLAGPSAVDALAAGAAFLNPVFDAPREGFFDSQHPYLAHAVGPPYVRNFSWADGATLDAAVRDALDGPDLPPLIPADLTEDAHAARVRSIFADIVAPPPPAR